MNTFKTALLFSAVSMICTQDVFADTLCGVYGLCSTFRAHGVQEDKVINGNAAVIADPTHAARYSLFYAEDAIRRSGLSLQYRVAWIKNIGHAYSYISLDGRRWILIDPEWALATIDKYRSSLPLTWILAHEIGHHIKGHNFKNIHNEEIEADQFAARILAQMRAYKWQTQRWIDSQDGSVQRENYPSLQERTIAVSKAYDEECKKPQGVSITDGKMPSGAKTTCMEQLMLKDILNPPTTEEALDNEGQILFGSVRRYVSSVGKDGQRVIEELKKRGVIK